MESTNIVTTEPVNGTVKANETVEQINATPQPIPAAEPKPTETPVVAPNYAQLPEVFRPRSHVEITVQGFGDAKRTSCKVAKPTEIAESMGLKLNDPQVRLTVEQAKSDLKSFMTTEAGRLDSDDTVEPLAAWQKEAKNGDVRIVHEYVRKADKTPSAKLFQAQFMLTDDEMKELEAKRAARKATAKPIDVTPPATVTPVPEIKTEMSK